MKIGEEIYIFSVENSTKIPYNVTNIIENCFVVKKQNKTFTFVRTVNNNYIVDCGYNSLFTAGIDKINSKRTIEIDDNVILTNLNNSDVGYKYTISNIENSSICIKNDTNNKLVLYLTSMNKWIPDLGIRYSRKETIVVCVKVKDIRPKYNNLKEWMKDPQNVYIGRSGIVFVPDLNNSSKKIRWPTKASIWANPFKIGKEGENVIEKYRNYIVKKLESNEITNNQLEELRGKTLGCWCKPNSCHGDVLLSLLN